MYCCCGAGGGVAGLRGGGGVWATLRCRRRRRCRCVVDGHAVIGDQRSEPSRVALADRAHLPCPLPSVQLERDHDGLAGRPFDPVLVQHVAGCVGDAGGGRCEPAETARRVVECDDRAHLVDVGGHRGERYCQRRVLSRLSGHQTHTRPDRLVEEHEVGVGPYLAAAVTSSADRSAGAVSSRRDDDVGDGERSVLTLGERSRQEMCPHCVGIPCWRSRASPTLRTALGAGGPGEPGEDFLAGCDAASVRSPRGSDAAIRAVRVRRAGGGWPRRRPCSISASSAPSPAANTGASASSHSVVDEPAAHLGHRAALADRVGHRVDLAALLRDVPSAGAHHSLPVCDEVRPAWPRRRRRGSRTGRRPSAASSTQSRRCAGCNSAPTSSREAPPSRPPSRRPAPRSSGSPSTRMLPPLLVIAYRHGAAGQVDAPELLDGPGGRGHHGMRGREVFESSVRRLDGACTTAVRPRTPPRTADVSAEYCVPSQRRTRVDQGAVQVGGDQCAVTVASLMRPMHEYARSGTTSTGTPRASASIRMCACSSGRRIAHQDPPRHPAQQHPGRLADTGFDEIDVEMPYRTRTRLHRCPPRPGRCPVGREQFASRSRTCRCPSPNRADTVSSRASTRRRRRVRRSTSHRGSRRARSACRSGPCATPDPTPSSSGRPTR